MSSQKGLQKIMFLHPGIDVLTSTFLLLHSDSRVLHPSLTLRVPNVKILNLISPLVNHKAHVLEEGLQFHLPELSLVHPNLDILDTETGNVLFPPTSF
jgi:hypothetical protein